MEMKNKQGGTDICKKKFREQAIWFIDASNIGSDRQTYELVWQIHKKCALLENNNEDGCSVDEFSAHRVLESVKFATTIAQLREFLDNAAQYTSINGSSYEGCKRISLVEILVYRFNQNWDVLIHCDGYNSKEIMEAQEKLEAAKKKMEEAIALQKQSLADAEAADEAEQLALLSEEDATKAAATARDAEMKFTQAKEAAEKCLEVVRNQENLVASKRLELESIANDDTKGVVKRNRAKAELAVMNTEDPLPLRSARIQNEAAVKRSQKSMEISRNAAVAAEETKLNSQMTRNLAIKSKNKALEAAKALDQVIPEAQQAFSELRIMLEEMIQKHRESKGLLFYIEREIQDAEQYLPKRGNAQLALTHKSTRTTEDVGNNSSTHITENVGNNSMTALPIKLTT